MYSFGLGAIIAENGGGTPSPVLVAEPVPKAFPASAPAPTSEPVAIASSSEPTSIPLIHPVQLTTSEPDPAAENADPLGIYGPELDPDAGNPLIHPVRVVEVRRAPEKTAAAGMPGGAVGWLLLLGVAGALMMGSDV